MKMDPTASEKREGHSGKRKGKKLVFSGFRIQKFLIQLVFLQRE
jgi:hypothetical protein